MLYAPFLMDTSERYFSYEFSIIWLKFWAKINILVKLQVGDMNP